jgi:hypothetical protein
MKNLKYLVMNLALMGAASVAMTGCPAPETTCETAEDCADGEICNADGVCEVEGDTTCVEDADCTTEGERCLPTADDATVSECRAPANCSEAADPAAYCTAELGEDGTCDTSVPETPACTAADLGNERRYVQILDSSPEGSCDSTTGSIDDNSDAGSDIMYVQLLDDQGQVLGYGKGVDYVQGTNATTDGNGDPVAIGYDQWETVFTGDAPDLDADQCPLENPAGSGDEFRQDSVVSLGCTGYLVVEFADLADITNILTLAEGQQVDVGEFGPYCTTAGGSEGSDTYDVYLCDTPVGADPATIDFDTDCLIELGTGAQGQTAFTVPAPDSE